MCNENLSNFNRIPVIDPNNYDHNKDKNNSICDMFVIFILLHAFAIYVMITIKIIDIK